MYQQPVDQTLKDLRTSPTEGLSQEQRDKSSDAGGDNNIPPPLPCPSWLCCLLPCLKNTELMTLHRDNVPQDAMMMVRGGKYIRIDAAGLVRGDIVQLDVAQPDDALQRCVPPADIQLIECSDDFETDRSILTGNRELIRGSTEPSEENVLYAKNVALLGTEVVKGKATGVVVNVGNSTEWVKAKYNRNKAD